MPKYIKILLVLSIFILLFLPQIYLWSHISDDSYISFRYIERFVSGEGLTFNPGERVEGFSNPLWVLIISFIHFVTKLDISIVARSLGVLFSFFTILCIAWITSIICKNYKYSNKLLFFFISSILLLIAPGFHVYMTTGLEGPLLGFLLIFGVGSTLKREKKWNFIAAFAFGLAAITRPEAPLYGILWYILNMKNYTSNSIDIKHEVLRGILFLLPIAFYQTFRLVYYQTFLPNTAVSKYSGFFGGNYGIEYLEPWLFALGGPVILVLLVLHWVLDFPKYKYLITGTLGPIIGNIIFIIYAQEDWMPFGRFFIPVLPLVTINLAYWLIHFIYNIRFISEIIKTNMEFISGVIVLGFLMASFLVWISPVIDYTNNRGLNMLMRGTDQIVVGKWLYENFDAGTTVATYRLGGISYAANVQIFWDFYGLTDKEAGKYISKNRPWQTLVNHPIIQRRPDVLALVEVPEPWGYKKDAELNEMLEEQYEFVESFRQGNYGTFDIWVSKKGLHKFRGSESDASEGDIF